MTTNSRKRLRRTIQNSDDDDSPRKKSNNTNHFGDDHDTNGNDDEFTSRYGPRRRSSRPNYAVDLDDDEEEEDDEGYNQTENKNGNGDINGDGNRKKLSGKKITIVAKSIPDPDRDLTDTYNTTPEIDGKQSMSPQNKNLNINNKKQPSPSYFVTLKITNKEFLKSTNEKIIDYDTNMNGNGDASIVIEATNNEEQLNEVKDTEEDSITKDPETDDDNIGHRLRRRPRLSTEEPINHTRTTRKAKRTTSKSNKQSEDEYIESENESLIAPDDIGNDTEDSAYSNPADARRARREDSRRKDKQFITNDDDHDEFNNDDDDFEIYGNNRSRRSRRRNKNNNNNVRRGRSLRSTRQHNNNNNIDDDDDPNRELTLEEELAELREEDKKSNTPTRKLHLRARKVVNYQLPPPITDNYQLEEMAIATSSSTNNKRRRNNNLEIRRLFPTMGPFGGSGVTSIFGSNIPSNAQNGVDVDIDSDDDDDLNITVNGTKAGGGGGGLATPSTKMGKLNTKKNNLSDTDPLGVDMNIDFSVIGGLDNYIDQLKEMVALPLLYPEVYKKFGITPPRGVLFHGPPGTGKTLMARALAASCSTNERKITFFMRKGSDCLSKWVGEAERQLRLLFEEAKNQQPSIIFFDEIDGLAPVRSSKQEQIHASIVSTLLALMDGMDNRGQVIVIGATNRPDSIDPALRRPGRFDREFYFPLPDFEGRKKILSIHTKKWDPKLNEVFLNKVANLTKGYGGADLRALCTEAALNSIQRKYPQIYKTNEKLKINEDEIKVSAIDFMKAIEKIVPSSARSISTLAAPLPENINPLLNNTIIKINKIIDNLIPIKKKMSTLEEAEYEDFNYGNDETNGFEKQEMMKLIQNSRICQPRILITGDAGLGQQYISGAILHHLEGFQVQSLDLGTLLGDSTRTPEATMIQIFIEARRHKPSVIFIPNIEIWFNAISDSARLTFASLLRNLLPSEKILVLGISDLNLNDINPGIKKIFGFNKLNNFELIKPNSNERKLFFNKIFIKSIKLRPYDYDDIENRKKKKLPILEIVKKPKKLELSKFELKLQEKKDMRLKNLLKIKLSGLMDLFKNRYKRFKKPPIDDMLLTHLFEPVDSSQPQQQWGYIKDGDKILEITTGKRFFNMDLDVVEERLWNGFYSEPKQFLRDIEMIYIDCITLGDRDRLLKASEMFANAQVAIDEISDGQFLLECRSMHHREIERQNKFIEQQKLKQAILEKEALEKQDGTIKENLDPLVEKHVQIQIQVDVPKEPTALLEGPIEESSPIIPNSSIQVIEEPVSKPLNDNAEQVIPSTDGGLNLSDENPDQVIPSTYGIGPDDMMIDEEVFDNSILIPTENGKVENTLEKKIVVEEEKGHEGPLIIEQSVEKTPKVDAAEEEIKEEEKKKKHESLATDQTVEKAPEMDIVEVEEEHDEYIFTESLAENYIDELVSSTAGFTVEELEQINSKLMDIIWEHRSNWNRDSILKEVRIEIEGVLKIISNSRQQVEESLYNENY